MSSLNLELATSGVAVILRSPEQHHDDLHQLASKFRSASRRAPGVVEVSLDDFLANLRELGRWRSPNDVQWHPNLARIAQEVHRDAQEADDQLQAPRHGFVASADEIWAHLTPGWTEAAGLTDAQRRDLAKLLSLRHGANFSVPGAGKTRVALAVFHALKLRGEVRRLLVVCPKSAYEAWYDENLRCLDPPLRVQVLDDDVDPSTELLLVNYERVDRSLVVLGRWTSSDATMLVLDEAHRMKLGAKGVYGSACLSLGPRARRRLILTGTPAPNGAKDIENLLGFVWPGQGASTVRRAVGTGSLREASLALRPLFTRTTKVELDLPPVNTYIRRVTLPPLHREIYSALVGEMSARAGRSARDLESLGRITMYLLMAASSPALLAVGTTQYEPLKYRVPPIKVPENASLTELMRDLPSYELSPKYLEAVRIVDENAASGRKTIVWSTFVRSLTTLESMLSRYRPVLVYGGTEDSDRSNNIQRFREDHDCYVLLSNPATLGEGINLHERCHDAVYIDRDFAAGRYLQSLDRIHRLGLRKNEVTNVTVISAERTIDELVETRLEEKLRFMGAILDDPSVVQLADLEEEPAVGAGIDGHDANLILEHLHVPPSA